MTDKKKTNNNSNSDSSEASKKYTGRQIERMVSAGTRQTYGKATIEGKRYPKGRGQDVAAKKEIESIRQEAEERIQAKETPAQTYVRTLRERGSEAGQRYARKLEEERFKKEYSFLSSELAKKGYKTTAAQVYVHSTLRGQPVEAVVKRYDKDVRLLRTRETTVSTNGVSGTNLVEVSKKEEKPITKVAKGYTTIPESIAKGFWKSFKYAAKPIKTPQESVAIVKDPDVQTLLLGAGLAVAPTAITVPVGGLFVGSQVKSLIEEPTYEKVGVLGFMGTMGLLGARAKLKGRVETKTIQGTKTTFIKSPTEGTYGYKTPSGKRAYVIVGEEAGPTVPEGLIPATESALVTTRPSGNMITGMFAYEVKPEPASIAKVQKTSQLKAAEQQLRSELYVGEIKPVLKTPSKLRRVYRKGIVQKRSISPLDTSAKGIFAKDIPKQPEIIKSKAPSSRQLRKEQRKQIIGRRSIKPLDVSPKGIFAKEIPLYQRPQPARWYKRQAMRRAEQQLKTEVLGGERELTMKLPSRIRKAARRQIVRRGDWWIQQRESIGARVPQEVRRKPIGPFAKDIPPYSKYYEKQIRKETGTIQTQGLKPRPSLYVAPKWLRDYYTRQRKIPYGTRYIGIGKSYRVEPYGYLRTTFRETLRKATQQKYGKPIILTPKIRPRASEIFKARPLPKPKPVQTTAAKSSSAEQVLLLKPQETIQKTVTIQRQLQKPKQKLESLQVSNLKGMNQISASAQTKFKKLAKLSKQKSALMSAQILSSKQGQAQLISQAQAQPQAQGQLQAMGQLDLQAQAQPQDQLDLQAQAQAQPQIQPQAQLQDQWQFKGQPPSTPSTIQPPPDLILKKLPKPKPQRKKKLIKDTMESKSYDVHVREGERRGDRFKKVAEGLPRNKALRKGKEIVDNFVEASFRIKESKKKAKVMDDLMTPNLSKFRRPKGRTKLPRETYVEMVKHRIDTMGEKRGLKYFKQKRKKELVSKINNLMAQKKKKQQIKNILATKKSSLVSTPLFKQPKGKKVKWL